MKERMRCKEPCNLLFFFRLNSILLCVDVEGDSLDDSFYLYNEQNFSLLFLGIHGLGIQIVGKSYGPQNVQ